MIATLPDSPAGNHWKSTTLDERGDEELEGGAIALKLPPSPSDAQHCVPNLPTGRLRALRQPPPSLVGGSALGTALFLRSVYQLCSLNLENLAVDAVYSFLDNALTAGKFAACNDVLDAADAKKLLPSVIISCLIITRRAKPHLPARQTFLERVSTFLARSMGETETERLLGKYR